jgi:hypothetical protein
MIVIVLTYTAPFFLFIFIMTRFKLLKTTKYEESVGAMYEGLDLKRRISALFHFFFISRRLFLVLTLIFS